MCNSAQGGKMDYFQNAIELINHSKGSLEKIKKVYEESINDKTIKPILLIEIKNFMENLRSALDYSAHGIFDKYGDNTKLGKIYFPYAWNGCTQQEFQLKNIIEKGIPGLTSKRPDIAQKIEDYQYFKDINNHWLPKFMDLNNENKHQQLTPQIRKETKHLNISSGGVSITMGEGCSIEVGSGTMIKIGNAIIPGRQNININSPAKIHGNAKQEIITWVSFNFQSNNEPVIPLLIKSLSEIEKIVNELLNI